MHCASAQLAQLAQAQSRWAWAKVAADLQAVQHGVQVVIIALHEVGRAFRGRCEWGHVDGWPSRCSRDVDLSHVVVAFAVLADAAPQALVYEYLHRHTDVTGVMAVTSAGGALEACL